MDERHFGKAREARVPKRVDGELDERQELAHMPTVEAGFLSFDKIAEAIKHHFATEDVAIISDFTNYDGVTFVARCTIPAVQGTTTVYVYLNLEPDGIVYRLSPEDIEITRSTYRSGSDYEMLKAQSESTKVVKSRPPFLYPELLGVGYEELWPRGAKVAVIGDPYMNCDKEGMTIVEYEYGEEMMPPVLEPIIRGMGDQLYLGAYAWAEDIHREDLQALSRIGHQLERPSFGFDTQPGNPYWHVVDQSFRMIGTVSELIASVESHVLTIEDLDETLESIDEQLSGIKQIIAKLVDGSWSRQDLAVYVEAMDHPADQEQATTNLGYYFSLKQRIMEQLGKPQAWTEYIQRWERYLDRLPLIEMKSTLPDIDQRVQQVRHWLSELPSITSPQRVAKAFSELEDTYATMLDWAYSQPREEDGNEYTPNKYVGLLYDSTIAEARSTGMMSDTAFGIDAPGYPVSQRTRKFLELAYRRAENATTYAREIWPKISAEKKRLAETGVQQNPETQLAYFRSFEQALVRSYIPITQPQKAIAVHGFFPDTVSIDPQDRIVALNSVTMHGWNRLEKAGFKDNIVASLPYLKVGGRYILGPVNQQIYFGQPTSEFDCNGLTQALEDMKTEGLITYRFVKGKREYNDDWSDVVDDRDQQGFTSDDQVLLPNESAASLVIERLR